MSELFELTAREAVDQLRLGAVSPSELIDAALGRIDQTDGVLNALPIMCADRARDTRCQGWHTLTLTTLRADTCTGLPIAIKDMKDVGGVLCTRGSPIFADHVPDSSDLLVTILESRGGVVLAKSNTPEFAAGANTFNEVFGKTRNPWNTDMTCGGSSGGSATALGRRTGMAGVRERSRRQPADPRELLFGRGTPPDAGQGRARAEVHAVRHAVGRRADGTHGWRHSADAGRAGWGLSRRPSQPTGACEVVRRLGGQP